MGYSRQLTLKFSESPALLTAGPLLVKFPRTKWGTPPTPPPRPAPSASPAHAQRCWGSQVSFCSPWRSLPSSSCSPTECASQQGSWLSHSLLTCTCSFQACAPRGLSLNRGMVAHSQTPFRGLLGEGQWAGWWPSRQERKVTP